MGFNLYAWAFQGYHVISVSPLRSQKQVGLHDLSLFVFLPLQSTENAPPVTQQTRRQDVIKILWIFVLKSC